MIRGLLVVIYLYKKYQLNKFEHSLEYQFDDQPKAIYSLPSQSLQERLRLLPIRLKNASDFQVLVRELDVEETLAHAERNDFAYVLFVH